jgi:hypothetical protein
MKTIVFAYAEMGCAGITALLNAGYEISAIFHPCGHLAGEPCVSFGGTPRG